MAQDILRAKKTVVLTGAGISVESGIPDFRSEQGLWRKYGPEEHVHIHAFRAQTEEVRVMLKVMTELIMRATPNPAHRELPLVEKAGVSSWGLVALQFPKSLNEGPEGVVGEMKIVTSELEFETTGQTDIIDISREVQEGVLQSRIQDGSIILFISGSTAALTTIEFESGVVNDLKKAIERIAPRDIPYEHDRRWGDGNGYSHVRASLLGPSLCIPIRGGRLLLGTWQQIVLLDFDNRPRRRRITIQIMGG